MTVAVPAALEGSAAGPGGQAATVGPSQDYLDTERVREWDHRIAAGAASPPDAVLA